MKVYYSNTKTIVNTQYNDPLLNHLTEKIINELRRKQRGRILDLGCGVGRVSILAAEIGFTIVGIDIERNALRLAENKAKNLNVKNRCKFLRKDITKKLPYVNEFDTVICSEVIEHVHEPEKVIASAYKSLRRNGILILTTPNDMKLWSILDEYAKHVKRFSIGEVEELLGNFSITYVYTIGYPFMRNIIKFYNFFVQTTKQHHTAKWRKNVLHNKIYYYIVRMLLWIDDFFNRCKKGTTIIAVAVKK